nr:hypothetical protein [Bacteroides acidifaciens]
MGWFLYIGKLSTGTCSIQSAKIFSVPLNVFDWQTGGMTAFTYRCWSGHPSKQ